ncbi:MAG: hypothetical protein QM770_01235 [Tepidisphaeraceae bacterium]
MAKKTAKKRSKKASRSKPAVPTTGKKHDYQAVMKGLVSMTTSALEAYDYLVTSVPASCNRYQQGDIITLYFETPPQYVTLNYGGACNGITAMLT